MRSRKATLPVPTMKENKLIVIGGGISGLSTAIAWLKNGLGPALVLEKEPLPGGCVATFSRQGYRFETVQLVPDMEDLLDYLGVKLPWIKFEGTLSRLFLVDSASGAASATLRRFSIPADGALFEKGLIRDYPAERRNIARFFHACRAMVEELAFLSLEPTPADIVRILVKCPHIIKASNDTWKRFLGRFGFRNMELVETLDLFSSYAGLSGDRCAALLTVSAMTTALAASWRPRTAFIKLPDAMRKRVLELGGEVRAGCRAQKILFSPDGKARGVLTSQGEELVADTVVSTVDTAVFLRDLVGEERLRAARGAYGKILSRLEMSPSMLAIHLGLDGELDLEALGLDGAYNVLSAGRSAHEEAFRAWYRGRDRTERGPELSPPGGGFHFAFYSPSLNNGSPKQTLALHVTPACARPWISLSEAEPEKYLAAKEEVARNYARLLEKWLIPGLSGHISYTDVSTPATVGRYLGSPTGSCFDMMPILSQFGLNRLPLRSPFPGLYHTKFSHGIWPAMHAGLQVVDLVSGGAIMNGGARYQRREV
jgi:all-trans-retinol 13,14-reductase